MIDNSAVAAKCRLSSANSSGSLKRRLRTHRRTTAKRLNSWIKRGASASSSRARPVPSASMSGPSTLTCGAVRAKTSRLSSGWALSGTPIIAQELCFGHPVNDAPDPREADRPAAHGAGFAARVERAGGKRGVVDLRARTPRSARSRRAWSRHGRSFRCCRTRR